MIIQCEKCQTRFRLDDSRVTDKGVKVRCTKCKHVFRVQKEGTEAGLFESAMAGLTTGAAQDEAVAAARGDRTFADELGAFEDTSIRSDLADAGPFETASFDPSTFTDASDEDYDSVSGDAPFAAGEPATGGVVDFSSFDFGDAASQPDAATASAVPVDDFTIDSVAESTPPAPRSAVSQGLDFSDDDMFGTVVQTSPEVTNDTISFDFEGDSFAESMEMGGQDSSGKGDSLFSLDAPGDAPFNLGEIDFGDELTSVAVQQVNPEDLKPSQEILFAPLAAARRKAAGADSGQEFPGDSSGDQGELPPLSIASRRKQSPLFSGLISVAALLLVAALGYFGYTTFSAPKETVATENGKISVRAVTATYIDNNTVGELLVISGEALNEYSKPRAALQVKVDLFDATGQSVASKSAYGGNPLTEEQLSSLPLDKIEAAMANQFGDSLANMEVPPGKTIPFVVVLANLPKGVKDYAVQSAGSTVATGGNQQ